jgi:2-iminobutanoate/2-iminopropanoate deaminase
MIVQQSMSLPLFHMIDGAPDPVAPFSHAVEVDGWVFVTGQMPFTGTSNASPYPEGIEAQTRQVMENLKRVLSGCALGLEHVVAARVFLAHFEDDYVKMNAVYAEYFEPGKRPARTCVGVTALARGARVEIDLIARRAGRSAAEARRAGRASRRGARSPRRAPAGGRSRRRGR